MKSKTSNRFKNITLIFSIFLAIIFYFCISNSNANSNVTESGMQEFTIKKVDDSGNPLPNVEFSITGDSKIEVKSYYSGKGEKSKKKTEKDKELEEKLKELVTLEFEDNEYKLKNPIEFKAHDSDVDLQGDVIYNIDLTNEIYDYTLNIKGQLNNKNTNPNETYAIIKIVTDDNEENKEEQKIESPSNNVDFQKKLEIGKKYTVSIEFYSKEDDNEENSFIINEINLKANKNTFKTDENGEIKQKFKDGSDLKIEEVKPLDGYYKAKGYQVGENYYSFDEKFSVDKNNKNEITVVNPKYRDLIIDKVDDAGNPVSNVTFDIDSEYVGDPKINLGSYYYKESGMIISNSKSEYVFELDDPIVLEAETEFKNKEESKEEENPEFELLNYFVEYNIDLTKEKLNYDLIINAILDNKKDDCNSYAVIKLDDKEMQRIDKNSSNVNFKTKLVSGKKYKLGIYFYYDGCIENCLEYRKDAKDENKILNAYYIGNTVTINSITLKTDNLYKTDKDGKIIIPVINGDKIHLKEIETPYGYIKADGYFVGDVYHTFDETYVVNSEEDQIDIKVVNNRIKRKVIVNHYLKGTNKKVAESEEREYPILDEYTTQGHTDLTGLTFEKNEAGEDVLPSNANGVVEDKDYDIPIVVDYYYEPQDIEITIHHYKEGTNEKLAEDEVLNYPVNLVPDENGIYRAENQTVKYVLESNENYQDLIKKYDLTDITSTINPDLTIKDYLESGKSFEISYYYNDLKNDEKLKNESNSNEKEDENVNENNDNNIISNIIEGIKTGDNIFIYILILLIALGVILKIKRNKNSGKHKK